MRIKELKKDFVLRGVHYSQLIKNDVFVIYRCEKYNGIFYFEVFQYRLSNLHPMSRELDLYDKKEAYPSDESFGGWAWCCSNEACLKKVMRNKFGIDDFRLESGHEEGAEGAVLDLF